MEAKSILEKFSLFEEKKQIFLNKMKKTGRFIRCQHKFSYEKEYVKHLD